MTATAQLAGKLKLALALRIIRHAHCPLVRQPVARKSLGQPRDAFRPLF